MPEVLHPKLGCRDQVTPVLLLPVTVAVNCSVPFTGRKFSEDGVTVTETGADWLPLPGAWAMQAARGSTANDKTIARKQSWRLEFSKAFPLDGGVGNTRGEEKAVCPVAFYVATLQPECQIWGQLFEGQFAGVWKKTSSFARR
jgi:hypothetical protein